jgi:hypothetical protein
MSKKKKTSPSLADFDDENILGGMEGIQDLTSLKDEEEEVVDEQEEEEVEETEEEVEEEKQDKKKAKPAKKEQVKPKSKSKEETQEDESEEEEEEEETEVSTEEEEDEGEDPRVFWEKVNQLTGLAVDVDYGTVDPLSPQGVALREKALVEKSIEDFVSRLEENYPEVYEALEYAHAGGNIEDLFKGEKDYSKITINDDDADHAKIILEEYYKQRGITNSARVKRMIAADEESEEGVVKVAQAALAEMREHQEGQRKAEIQEQLEIAKQVKEQDQKFVKSLDDLIGSGQLATFKIPSTKEAQEFRNFVRQHIQRDGKGGYVFVTPLDQGNLERQLQAEYFRFKKGDLESLITVKAGTIKTQQLRLKAQSEGSKKKTTVPEERTIKKSIRDLEV